MIPGYGWLPELALSLELVTESVSFLTIKLAGKSYTERKLVEQLTGGASDPRRKAEGLKRAAERPYTAPEHAIRSRIDSSPLEHYDLAPQRHPRDERRGRHRSSRTVKGRNGGTLTPHPPGSKGGVRRGPSRFPSRNVVRGMFMGALAADRLSLEDLRRKRKHRKGLSLIPFAMAEHCKQGFKNIAIDAALGKPEAYGPFLRMMDHAHMISRAATAPPWSTSIATKSARARGCPVTPAQISVGERPANGGRASLKRFLAAV